ncbi:MAG: molybdopterin-dependent oxidoreductase [Candidatus Methylomirabilis sp.]
MTDRRRRLLLKGGLIGLPILFGADHLLRTLAGASREEKSGTARDPFPQVAGLSPEVTPNDKFYRISKNLFDPVVKAEKWSLEIKGMVERPFRLGYDELKALPAVQQYATLECISNEVGGELISNALWKGVRLQVLLERAGVKPKAKKVVFTCVDGYSTGIPPTKALHPDTILAHEMNGVTLPPDHGFPVRLINPGHYGMKNPKWITGIELVDQDYKGYWETRGWSDESRVKTMGRIDVPIGGSSIKDGKQIMAGIAFAGDRGIQQVDVSTDGGGTWHKAILKKALSPYTWVLWAFEWELPKEPTMHGRFMLKVRATDGKGQVQTAEVAPPLPDGASGLHTVMVKRPK